MNVTFDDFDALAPDETGRTGFGNNHRRLTKFIACSLLIHLAFVMLVLNSSLVPETLQPLKIIPALTVIINNEQPAATVKQDSETVAEPTAVDKAVEQVPIENKELEVPQDTNLVNLEELQPEARQLIVQSLEQAAKIGKEMEALVNTEIFMTNTFREKLELARIKQAEQPAAINLSDELMVYHNTMGDRVYQIGDDCYKIPVVFFFQTFKELNTIMAVPVLGGCGNRKKEDTIKLK